MKLALRFDVDQPSYSELMRRAEACQSRREAVYLLRWAERLLRQEKALEPHHGRWS